jgi:hypothetical protein
LLEGRTGEDGGGREREAVSQRAFNNSSSYLSFSGLEGNHSKENKWWLVGHADEGSRDEGEQRGSEENV